MAKAKVDRIQFSSVAPIETVAGTVATEQFVTGNSLRDKVGILIHSVDMEVNDTSLARLAAAGDGIQVSLHQIALNHGLGGITMPAGMVSRWSLYAVSAALTTYAMPFSRRFDEPVIAHPAALYGSCVGIALGGIVGARIRIGYTYIDLDDADYQDIMQTIIAQNVL